jgi:cytochrome c5
MGMNFSFLRSSTSALLLTAGATAFVASCSANESDQQDDSALNRNAAAAPFDSAQLDGIKRAGIEKEVDVFLHSPMTTGGIPMIIFRLLPDIAKDIWGDTVETIPDVGLYRDPSNPKAPLPLGLGYASATPTAGAAPGQPALQVVNLTCAACHSGQIGLPGGKRVTYIGAPSSRFDVPGFREKLVQTTARKTFTGQAIRDLIRSKEAAGAKPGGNPHWIYNDPAMAKQHQFEVAAILSKKTLPDGTTAELSDLLLSAVKQKTEQRQVALRELLGPQTPGEGGQTDGVGGAMALFGVKPHGSIGVDYPKVFTQALVEKGQYDGTVANGFFRNIAAVAGGGTSGRTPDSPNCVTREFPETTNYCIPQPDLSIFVAYQTWKAVERLPAPKYPLPTDAAKVKQGQGLYKQYCSSCHAMPDAAGNIARFTKLIPLTEDPGADPIRSNQFKDKRAPLLRAALVNACKTGNRTGKLGTADYTVPLGACDAPADDIVRDTSDNPVLAAQPLTGVWATAPYLHNGSVPSMRALLLGNTAGARPTTFLRGGDVTFDPANIALIPKKGSGEYLLDTRTAGRGNRGHATLAMLGRDWSKRENSQDLEALLEYIKTL